MIIRLNLLIMFLFFYSYQILETEFRKRDTKWNHAEDCDLLRGYQIFGEKWPLIQIYYLPQRKKKEMKLRFVSFTL